MASRSRRVHEAVRIGLRDLGEVIAEGRDAREQAGVSQRTLAAAIGWRREKVARFEARHLPKLSLGEIAAYCGALGLHVRVKAYVQGPSVRDVGQLGVTKRFLHAVSPAWRPRLEVGVPILGDQRATDIVLDADGQRVSVEVFTRLRDVQAQLRAALLKWRDSGTDRLVVVLAASRTNRAALAPFRDLLRGDLPLDTRATLFALRAGRPPAANGIVVI